MGAETFNIAKAAALRQVYGDYHDAVKTDSTFLSFAEDGQVTWPGGSKMVFLVHTQRGGGSRFSREGGVLPYTNPQAFQNGNETALSLYTRKQFDRELEIAYSSQGAWWKGIRPLLNMAQKDTTRHVDITIGDGDGTGVLATVDGAQAATTSVKVRLAANGFLDERGAWDLDGFPIWIGTSAEILAGTADQANVLRVVDDTMVVDGPGITVADGDLVVVGDPGGPTDYQIVWNGLRNIVDDASTLHGIDPATTPLWQSLVLDNGGTPRDLTVLLLYQFITTLAKRNASGSGKQGFNVTKLFLPYEQLMELLEIASNNSWIQQPPGEKATAVNLAPGTSGIKFATADIVPALHCSPSRTFGLCGDEEGAFEFAIYSGFLPRLEGHEFESVPERMRLDWNMFEYGNVICRNRRAWGVIKDLRVNTALPMAA